MNKKKLTRVERPILGEISGSGLRANFWNYVERVTGKRSLKAFIRQGILFTLFSDIPSIWGVALRSQAYKKVLGSIGESCFIERNVRFIVPQRIFLGNRVYIGENVRLDACFTTSQIRIGNDVSIHEYSTLKAGIGKIIVHEGVTIAGFVGLGGDGGLEIGKNSIIANHVELITGNYVFDDPSIPIKRQGVRLGRIEIGEDVWLGVHTIVLPGVRIGDGAVVGAGSVVTKGIPSYSVALGNPAKVIRKREEREIQDSF